MSTKPQIKSRQALAYLMQHLEDAPGYKVWFDAHGGGYESNMAYLKEVQEGLEITPQELWLSTLSVYTFIEQYLMGTEDIDIGDTSQVTRLEVVGETRLYTNYGCKNVRISMQDNNKTMKIFINYPKNEA